jgi:hypothetical protein
MVAGGAVSKLTLAGGGGVALGIFLGGVWMGSAAFGVTVAPAVPQQVAVEQPPSQQPLSRWKWARRRSRSLGPLLQQESHLGAQVSHLGAQTGVHLGAGGAHLGAAQVSQLLLRWKPPRSLPSSLWPPQSSQLDAQVVPQQALAAGVAAVASPANQAVTNKNAAFTRYTS